MLAAPFMVMKRRIFLVFTGFVAIFTLLYIYKPGYFTQLLELLDPVRYDDDKFHTSKMFTCNGKWMDDYSRYHANSLKSESGDRKFLIYYCTGHNMGGCGGYGNRMMGIISLFYLSVVLNRTFMIHWGGPELIETYLKPNRIDWKYNELKLKGKKSLKRYWGTDKAAGYDDFFVTRREGNFLRWSQGVNFRIFLNNPVEKVSTIWFFAEKIWDNPHTKTIAKNLGIPAKSNRYPHAMIGCAMSYLFKKSKTLMREFASVQSAYKERSKPFIGIHIRSNDYQFGSNNPHSVRTRNVGQVFSCAQRVEKALKNRHTSLRNKKFTWVLAADSKEIKAKALRDFPDKIVTLDILPRHLDISSSGHQSILKDVLMDQLMLLESDYLIITAASTFSVTVLGLRQFPANSFTYGESCKFDEKKIILAGA